MREHMATTTERLVLRAFRGDDGEGLHMMLSDPEVVRFEPYGVRSRADSDREAEDRATDDRFIAVCDRTDSLVGSLWVTPQDAPRLRTWQIGFVFRRDRWGQGLATEAVHALQDVLFSNDGAHRIVARCNPDNVRSWRLLERTGFAREGHMREAASFVDDENGDPVWHDAFHYAILAREWRHRRTSVARP
jgi:RimJ/RimL family protein N-acetyltransferase